MDIKQACALARNNRDAVYAAKKCSCYSCLQVFTAEEIVEWIDMEKTAICPHCGVDSVLPGVVAAETLEAANKYWFSEEEDETNRKKANLES